MTSYIYIYNSPCRLRQNRDGTLFFTLGGCARLLLQSYQYPNLSQGADRVAGQLRGDKECPFRGVTKSSRVWRKVTESDARSVRMIQTTTHSRKLRERQRHRMIQTTTHFMKPHKRHRHRMIQTTTHSRKLRERQRHRMIQTTTHFMKPHKRHRHRMIQTTTHSRKLRERHRHRMIQTTTHSRKPHRRQTQNDTDNNPLHETAQKTQTENDTE